MVRRRSSLFTAMGILALSAGLALQLWMHGNYAHFASGFLLGVSIALLIIGFARPTAENFRMRITASVVRLRNMAVSIVHRILLLHDQGALHDRYI